MEIATARLRLDALRDGDAAALFAYRADPAVSRWQAWKPASVTDAAGFITAQQRVEPGTPGAWWQRAIRLRGSDELIGDVGLHFLRDATVELGISLAPAHQHQGHARAVLEVVLDFAFGGLHQQRVIASVDPGNEACIGLLEGLGLRRTPPAPGVNPSADLAFAMMAAEWLAPERPVA